MEKGFDFKKDIHASERKEAFGELLNILNSPHLGGTKQIPLC